MVSLSCHTSYEAIIEKETLRFIMEVSIWGIWSLGRRGSYSGLEVGKNSCVPRNKSKIPDEWIYEEILKEEGYDYSYIYFTGVAPWYEKLGYKSTIK